MPLSTASSATRRQPMGPLLALTGLMLEKESELSSAVVGRAARQQDQGEQSPMSAAEMERRIGLMGRLHDAAALLAEAHAAMDEMTETVAVDLREFNQDLPVEIRPAMRGLPAVTERAAAMVVGPADFHVGRFDEWDPNPPHTEGGLYIVYYYRGAKVVQSILDT